jgi:type IV secretion system protein VirD4
MLNNSTYRATPDHKPLTRQRNLGAHGGAGFALLDEVKAFNLIAVPENKPDSVYLGHFLDPYALNPSSQFASKWETVSPSFSFNLAYASENNIVTIAPAGSGKGTTAIIPTLLTCEESMFVLDVKGENWFVSLPARHAMGHQVVLIDPFDIWGDDDQLGNIMPPSDQFNPLEHLRPEQKNFVSEIDKLASCMIIPDGRGEDHWINRARQMVTCLMAHVCSDPLEIEDGHNNLPYVHELLGQEDNEFATLLKKIHLTNDHRLCRKYAASFLTTKKNKDGTTEYTISKEVSGIKSTAMGQLGFLNHEGICHFLSGSTFSFGDLRTKPMTIFCMFPPDELDTYFRFARLMVQCFFNSLSKTPKRNDRRVLALLDEQAKLRHMEIIETSVALLRGYMVRIWSIFQDITQIQSIYGQAWETFISNAGVIQVMTTNGATTAEYFSRRTGNETVTETKVAFSAPPIRAQDPIVRGGTNTSENTIGVSFLSPQDLYAMPRDKTLLYVQGLPYPVITTREPYFSQQSNGFFNGRPFAPHPVHHEPTLNYPTAFDWMKDYLTNRAKHHERRNQSKL